jgi:hypothetical protein
MRMDVAYVSLRRPAAVAEQPDVDAVSAADATLRS